MELSSPMPPPKPLCRHNLTVCKKCDSVEDSGKRMAERINLMLISQPWDVICNSWMAFRLEDGNTDGVLYDTRADAITHQFDERWCCYFSMRNALGGVDPLDCQLFINLHRQVYDAGGRLQDPEGRGRSLIVSTKAYDIMRGRVNPSDP